MSDAASFEVQQQVQQQLITMLSFVPDFSKYSKAQLYGGELQREVNLKGGRIVDHQFARWFVNDPNYDKLEDLQYNLKEIKMAEIEYGGVKAKGSKLLLILPLIATLGGGAWATFEFYKDYTDMKEIISNIDTDKIEANQKQINQQLSDAIDYSRDIKNGLREDIVRLERIVDKVEDDMNLLEDKTRKYVDDAEVRFDTKRDALLNQYVAQKDMLVQRVEQLKKYMDKKLQRALDNPLAK